MNNQTAHLKLEDLLAKHKLGVNKLDPSTAGFLQLYINGGIHKATKQMGWIKVKEMAKIKGINEEILCLMDCLTLAS